MNNIKRPQKNHTEVNCIKCPFELAAFVSSFKESILFLPVYIAAVTGMRFSEIAGLRWSDVDLKQCLIAVNRSLHWKKENGELWGAPHNRHSHATLLLAARIPPRYVSARLGHSSTAFTQDTYVCFTPEDDLKTADTFQHILKHAECAE